MPNKDSVEKSPGATLTQRRNGNNALPSGVLTSKSASQSNLKTLANESDKQDGSVLKIVIWGIIILAVGIGLAFLVRNMTQNTSTNNAQTTGDSIDTIEDNDLETEEEKDAEIPEDNTNEEALENDVEDSDKTDEPTIPTEEDITPPDTTENPEDTDVNTSDYSTFSTTNKTLEENVSSNVVTISGYTYETDTEKFAYSVKLANTEKYPTTTAVVNTQNNTLTLEVDDIKADNIVGNGGSGSTDLGSTNAKSVEISNKSNTTTFIFSLDKITEFRLVKNISEDGTKLLTLEIKNR